MKERVVKYSFFGGIDQNAKGNGAFAADAHGFIIDDAGALRKRQGFLEFLSAPSPITGIWAGGLGTKRVLAYVSGARLYVYDFDTGVAENAGALSGGESSLFGFGGALYILSGGNYHKYDGAALTPVEGYIPLIAVSATPEGGGTRLESINALTPKRREQFTSDGVSKTYRLAENPIAAVVSVTVNGAPLPAEAFASDLAAGTVVFADAPEGGLNNVEITYAAPSSHRSDILGFAHVMLFGSNADERVFLWGNPQKPATRMHSELAGGVPSAEYFPVDAYTVVGNTAITDIVQQYDRQLIFTENSAYFSFCEMKTSLSGQLYASFPVYPLNPVKGSFIYGAGCTLAGMPVTLCGDGLNAWEPTEVESQKNAVCFSGAVKSALKPVLRPGSPLRLFSDIAGGNLLFAFSGVLYIYNIARKSFSKLTGLTALKFCGAHGRVYIVSQNNKIYTLSETPADYDALYATHYTDFGKSGLKNIKSITLIIEAEENCGGALRATWHNGRRQRSKTVPFSVPEDLKDCVVKLQIPLHISLTQGAAFGFSCPAGKRLSLLGYEVAITEKGESPYGI